MSSVKHDPQWTHGLYIYALRKTSTRFCDKSMRQKPRQPGLAWRNGMASSNCLHFVGLALWILRSHIHGNGRTYFVRISFQISSVYGQVNTRDSTQDQKTTR